MEQEISKQVKIMEIKDEKLIEEQIRKAEEQDGKCFGMSYEQGIKDALEWVLYGDEPPLE